MNSDHSKLRQDTLDSLSNSQLDLLIIGGGIVGAGIARDAALRGLKTGLVEKSDFAYGTSSRSSRLLHGGLRYLAQGHVGLVREASIEKSIVHSIASHISSPLAFVFPTYEARPWEAWPLWKLRIGVKIYDLLCGGRNLGKSGTLSPAKTIGLIEGINRSRLTGAVRYFDGLTSDSRLVIDTLRSASNAGAHIVNYCKALELVPTTGVWVCGVRDELTQKTREITSRCVINATGPWAEQFPQSTVRLRLTKGIHLVIQKDRLPVPDAVVMVEGTRILFAIPWGERVILGTTDTDYDDNPDNVVVDTEDISYVLEVVNGAFPEANIQEMDIIGSWAGLRPLIADSKGRPSDISRSHEIKMPKPGWIDVAGGKLTTYRLMAEQTVNKALKYLGRQAKPCETAIKPLLSPEETEGISSIVPPEPSQSLVDHFCKNEWAISPEDVMTRRSSWAYYRTDADELTAKVAEWMQ